jgi:hypothetical protein
MKLTRLTAIAIVLLVGLAAEGFVQKPSVATVFSPRRGGNVFFLMVPQQKDASSNVISEPHGIAYRVYGETNYVELYRTKGWYSKTVLISNSGEYLVRIENPTAWTADMLKPEDKGLVFYANGRPYKEYTIAMLVKDKSRLVSRMGGLAWTADLRDGISALDVARLAPMIDESHKVHVWTVDKLHYTFDLQTGSIESSEAF